MKKMSYLSFWIWFILLIMAISSSICFSGDVITLFLFMAEQNSIFVWHIFFINLPDSGKSPSFKNPFSISLFTCIDNFYILTLTSLIWFYVLFCLLNHKNICFSLVFLSSPHQWLPKMFGTHNSIKNVTIRIIIIWCLQFLTAPAKLTFTLIIISRHEINSFLRSMTSLTSESCLDLQYQSAIFFLLSGSSVH